MRRHALFITITAASLTWLAISVSARTTPNPETRTATAPLVRVAHAIPAPAHRAYTFTGRVGASHSVALSFTMSGRIASRDVSAGDVVRAGQRLATLDPLPLAIATRAAQAQLRQTTSQREQLARDLQRAKNLLDAQAGSREEVERLEAALLQLTAAEDAARTQLQETRRQQDESELRAPQDGIITTTLLDAADVVSPGRPVLMLSSRSRAFTLELLIPESLIDRVKPGMIARVSSPLTQIPTVEAPLIAVSDHAVEGAGLFIARLELPAEQGWRSGLTAQVALDLDSPHGLLVPLAAVISPDMRTPEVVCVRQGLARAVPVELVALHERGAIIRGDLQPQELVIVSGHFAVERDARVEVQSP
jgi:RND family efflux transporter MFP subunit